MSDGGINVFPENDYMSEEDKLKHFDVLMHKVRQAIKNDDATVPVYITTDINPIDNSISIKIEASGVINNWGEKFNISNDAHNNRIKNLSEQLENMFQEYIPECDSDCCSHINYDELINELCLRAAAYSYNYTGSITVEDIEAYVQKEKSSLETRWQKSKVMSLKQQEQARYYGGRQHFEGENYQ